MSQFVVEVMQCYCGFGQVPVKSGGLIVEDRIHFINEPCHYVNPLRKDLIMQQIEYTQVVRRPFKVDAVEITEDNISACAKYIGDIRQDDDGTIYILVDRRLVPHVDKAHLGYMMTRMGKQVRVYSKRAFKQQFLDLTPNVQEWIDFLEKEASDNA